MINQNFLLQVSLISSNLLEYCAGLLIYHENTLDKAASILNVSVGCVRCYARRIGISKRYNSSEPTPFVSMKINPNVIPGGLPEEEGNYYE